jgi:hypothetical protein
MGLQFNEYNKIWCQAILVAFQIRFSMKTVKIQVVIATSHESCFRRRDDIEIRNNHYQQVTVALTVLRQLPIVCLTLCNETFYTRCSSFSTTIINRNTPSEVEAKVKDQKCTK